MSRPDVRIHATCSTPQYARHIRAVWQHLPDEVRGEFIEGVQAVNTRFAQGDVVMVGGWQDCAARATRPQRLIYVEHGAGQSYCLAPTTRVLTGDLRWLPISKVAVGDELVAFEEERTTQNWRQWRPATVMATTTLRQPCYDLLLSDGTRITASAEHRWLRRERETFSWVRTADLQPSSTYPGHSTKLIKPFDVWDEDRSWGAGYLAAAFGQFRGAPVEVVECRYVGEQTVVGLTTSTGTLIAEGVASHNSGDPRTARRPGYHGSILPPSVVACIAPRADVAKSWDRPAFVAGCPAIDEYAGLVPPHPDGPTRPLAVITFHWGADRLCAEAASAADHYLPRMAEVVAQLRASGVDVVGHWHPRRPTLRGIWNELGVDWIPDIDTVLRTAHIMIADNTSVMYEMAALGRSVIALNCPGYRRDVEHGLRFWTAVPGWQVDSVDELLALDVMAYWYEDWSVLQRDHAVRYAYGGVPVGGAGAAAAAWLMTLGL